MMNFIRCTTPLGPMRLAGADGALAGAWFVGQKYQPPGEAWREGDDDGLLGEAARQLDAYFAGRLRRFDLPLAPAGTPYQRAVWAAIAAVDYGTTARYGELARAAGGSARAAGAATGRNPLAIIVPCHRIVAVDGALTGYAGGLARKAALLRLEAGAGEAQPRAAATPADQPSGGRRSAGAERASPAASGTTV